MELDVRCFNECNMDCSFCIRKSQLLVDTNKAQIIKSLRDVLQKDYPIEGIGLTGGEPLLDPEFVKQIITVVHDIRPACPVVIATNGSLITKDLVDYFNENKVKLGISFHGITGNKSFFEGMVLGKNLQLIGDVLKLKNFVFKRVVQPFEEFATHVCDLYNIFDDTHQEISLDITAKYNINSIIHFENELRKIADYNNRIPLYCSFNYAVLNCNFDQLSILNDGRIVDSQCKRTENDPWTGCNKLYDCLNKDEFNYFIDITNRFKKGLL